MLKYTFTYGNIFLNINVLKSQPHKDTFRMSNVTEKDRKLNTLKSNQVLYLAAGVADLLRVLNTEMSPA